MEKNDPDFYEVNNGLKVYRLDSFKCCEKCGQCISPGGQKIDIPDASITKDYLLKFKSNFFDNFHKITNINYEALTNRNMTEILYNKLIRQQSGEASSFVS